MGVVVDTKEFQENHFNHLGKQLEPDGVLGPQTRWSMNYESLSVERRTVIAAAWPYVDQLKEIPPASNDDPSGIIRGWLKAAGAKRGDPWCAAAASAWLSASTPVRIPGALRLLRHFPATDSPWAGDLGGYPTNDKGNGHVFLIVGVGATEVMTYEGNCNNACRCVRRPRQGLIFARTFDETLGTCPKVILSVPLMVGGGTR